MRGRHGPPARLQKHFQPRAAAGRAERGPHRRRRPAGLRRHPGDAGRAAPSSAARIEPQPDGALARARPGRRNCRCSRRKLFLGNAGTAMRPLTAALALLAANTVAPSSSAACRACTNARSAIWSMRCASSAARWTAWARKAIRHCGWATATPQTCNWISRSACAAMCPASSSPPCCWRCRWWRGRDVVIDVVGELISTPLHRDHAQPAGALRRAGAARRLAALHHPGRQPLPLARAHPRRRRRLVGQLLHRAGCHRTASAGTDGITIEGVGLSSIQGDIRFVEAARLMGADVTRRSQPPAHPRAAPGRSRPSTWTATTSPTRP